MYKLRTFNALSSKGLDRFSTDIYQVGADVSPADALMLRSHKLHEESIDASVIAVARAGAGVNNIPVDEYSQRGIVVFNTPGANANAVKELVAAALLLGSRNIFDAMNYVQTLGDVNNSAEMHKLLEANKKKFAGSEITGMTLGVVGLGAIGAIVANMALTNNNPKGDIRCTIGPAKNRNTNIRAEAYINSIIPFVGSCNMFPVIF